MEYTSPDKLSLANMSEGGIIEAFDEELAEVLTNIHDPNTNPTAIRTITLTVKIKPDVDRTVNSLEATCKPGLAPRRIIATKFMSGINKHGVVEAREFIPPEQLKMDFKEKPGVVLSLTTEKENE